MTNGETCRFFSKFPHQIIPKTIKLLSKNQEFVKAITENKVHILMKKRIFKQKPMLLPFAAKAAAPLEGSLLSGIAGKIF